MVKWAGSMARLPGTTLWLIWITAFCLATVSMATSSGINFDLKDLHFTQDLYNVSVPENSMVRTFVTPASKMGIYVPEDIAVKISYHIVNSEDDLFKVESSQVGDFVFLLIRTHSSSYGRLNREFRSDYRLQIKAMAEYARQTYETFTSVVVFISDINDLQPLFDHDSYDITVAEDTVLHTSIAKVSAYDGDEGINAEIYYSFAQRTNTFAIHPTSGEITLTRPLNYFLQKEYKVKIVAQDRGPVTLQSLSKRPALLTVHVTQVNFFPPDISIQKLPRVIEPGQNEIVLAMVNVRDRDMGDNGKVQSVKIVQGSQNGLITLQKGENEGEHRVILLQSDHSSLPGPGFNVTLMATDRGQPALSANESFYVSVYDTKVTPKFAKSQINAQIEEISPVNTPVVFLSVRPSDSHFDVRYRIVDGNNDNLFKINQISGLLSTSAPLDAEVVKNVQLRVMVYDSVQKFHVNSDTCLVNIRILDNNDNAPQFYITDNVSEIYIQENLGIGTSVFTIGAKDADSGENGKISFSLINVHSIPFDIDPFTGVIRTTEVLDYETMRHLYKLDIRISDWGTPYSRENNMIFKINLQDANDNQPEFEKVGCTGYLSKDAPVNSEILIIPAIDFDVNDVIHYYINGGNEYGCFNVDLESARITLNCSLKDVAETKLHLQAVAKDGIHESESMDIEIELVDGPDNSKLPDGLVSITCQPTDVFQKLQNMVTLSRQNNEPSDFGIKQKIDVGTTNTAPEFLDTVSTKLEISESVAVGTVIAKLQAVDNDSGYNGTLVYVIESGDIDGAFKVDMYTGGLKILSELNREIRGEYSLLVKVSDLGSPPLSASITLSVKVLDENDNAPQFEQEVYSASVAENVKINTTIAKVSATDKDLGKNAEIKYTIVSHTDHFSINPRSGLIVVNKPLDRESHSVYTILVRASDRGEKQVSLSSTATVLVEVTDVNDNIPEFTPDVYSVRIREDLPVGSVVTVVTAADTDEGRNGEVDYQLVYGEDYFEIDSETGVIRIIRSLDYEFQQVHNISVRAQDGGVPPLISVCFINIEVVDVNENLLPPEFKTFFAHGYVLENEPVGTTVMFLTAEDPDGDGVSYSIRDGSGLGRFSIDANGKLHMYSRGVITFVLQ